MLSLIFTSSARLLPYHHQRLVSCKPLPISISKLSPWNPFHSKISKDHSSTPHDVCSFPILQIVPLQITLPTCNFGSLYGTQLLRPSLCRYDLFDSAQLVRSVPRNSYVVVALKNELDVTHFEGRGLAEFGKTAGSDNNLVDEIIGNLEEGL